MGNSSIDCQRVPSLHSAPPVEVVVVVVVVVVLAVVVVLSVVVVVVVVPYAAPLGWKMVTTPSKLTNPILPPGNMFF